MCSVLYSGDYVGVLSIVVIMLSYYVFLFYVFRVV